MPPPPKFNKLTNSKTGKLKKIPTVAVPTPVTTTEDESQQQFEVEICWCVNQLEKQLETTTNLTTKQVEDINKSIRILKSTTQPIIKKRQLMRNAFGDYRRKMYDEERRMAASAGRVTFQATPANNKSQFLRKAILKPSGEEFRFNFQVEELSLSDKGPEPVPVVEEAVPVPEPPTTATPVNTFQYQQSNNGFRFNFENKQ